jgi:hypothetical protein
VAAIGVAVQRHVQWRRWCAQSVVTRDH